MLDLLKGFIAGSWGGTFAWVIPNCILPAMFWFFVYSPMREPPLSRLIWSLQGGQTTALLITIGVVAGLLASAISAPLYRFLEGYAWPRSLRNWRIKAHQARKSALEERLEKEPDGIEYGLLFEKLARYPTNVAQIAPTRLGNAIRSLETYGKTRFNLDSQSVWSELFTLVPDALRKEVDQARAVVDFFVALLYALAIWGLASLLAGIDEPDKPAAFVFASICLIGCWGAYESAIQSCAYWRVTVQALVNVGRAELAKAVGLVIPPTLEEEQKMWGLVVSYVSFADPTTGQQIDKYRAGAAKKSTASNDLVSRLRRAIEAFTS